MDGSAVRVALDHALAWAGAPDATGAEVAWALRRVGCETRLDGPEHVAVLRNGVVIARLPLAARVHGATLRALLRTFSITPEQLDDYLADPAGRRDI